MKKLLFLLVAIFFLCPFIMAQGEKEVKKIIVIVNAKSPLFDLLKVDKKNALSAVDLKRIYKVETLFWKDVKILPVHQKDKKIFETFLAKFVDMSPTTYKNFLVKKVMENGVSAPKVVENVEELIKYISENVGAIGYLWDSDLTGEEKGIKVLPIKEK